ncbi:hypothetical protein DEFR109230_19795 [Deinococcus frigens]
MAPNVVFWKKCPSDVMAPIVESLSQLAGSVTRGVTPLIAHVRLLTPLSENPTSSRETRVAPSATFF